MRTKTHLTLQKPKNAFRKKILASNRENSKPSKRTLRKTPLKSPYKSPLYKASPLNKKRKVGSSRRLFQDGCSTSQSKEFKDECYFSQFKEFHDECYTSQSNEFRDKCKSPQSKGSYFPLQNETTQNNNNDCGECVVKQKYSQEIDNDHMAHFLEINSENNAYPSKSVDDSDTHESIFQNIKTDSPLRNAHIIKEMEQLLPIVMAELADHGGLDELMLVFFRQVKNHKFPLTNISFQLWLEVVKWHENKSTTSMRYSDITKLFWKLGWRAFGERFINFMGGFKSHGNVVKGTDLLGEYSPENSEVNFAVPDIKVLRQFDLLNIGGERQPGIYDDMMSFLSSSLEHQSSCLTFDGKKLKMGLTEDSGDVDLLGHETEGTLAEKKKSLREHIQELIDMRAKLTAMETNNSSVRDLSVESRSQVCNLLTRTIKRLSTDIFQVREIRRKKEYCKTKLIERGGDTHWRKGKYVFAISAIIAFLHDIDEFLNKASEVLDDIEGIVASLNNCTFVSLSMINLYNHPDYVSISSQKEVIKTPSKSTRLINQRTLEWSEMRKKAKVTGSTLFAALGGEGLKRQQDHFEKVMCGVPESEPNDSHKKAMDHGVENEINAIATVVGKVLPVIEPGLKFYEEGCCTISTEDNGLFMVVSPDGSLRTDVSLQTTRVAIEIKCPYYSIHSRFPPRYLLQCLSEIEVLDVPYLLFVSWTIDETTVFSVQRDRLLFQKAMELAMSMYGGENVKKPTKYSAEQKELKLRIEERSKMIQMIGRFKSLVHSDTGPSINNNPSVARIPVRKLAATLQEVKALTESHFEINRERASEAVVFLLCDLDRSWNKECVKWAPVAWFPKGYSLTTKTMRDIAEEVHTCAHDNGIHVPCSSFDGQWHGIVTRSADGQPLTMLQLQKDVWNMVIKMSKSDIISVIKTLNRKPTWNREEVTHGKDQSFGPNRHVIIASYEKVFPKYRKCRNSPTEETDKDARQNSTFSETEHHPSLAESIPQNVVDTSDTSCDVLKMILVEDREELEAFRSNVREALWASEVEDQHCSVSDLFVGGTIANRKSEQLTRSNEACSNDKTLAKTTPVKTLTLQENDMSCILAMFKTTRDSNKKSKWDTFTPSDLLVRFQTQNELRKFLDVELRIIVRYLRKTNGVKVKESATKQIKIAELSKLFGLDDNPIVNSGEKRRVIKRRVNTLSDLALKKITQTHSKHELSIWFSENEWPKMYESWSRDIQYVTVNGTKQTWFYKPDYSKTRKQFEVRCIDSTHLLTRSRQKSCRGGLDGYSNEPWRTVAAAKKTLLTKIMVDEVIDPMSVQMAKTHFSEDVEDLMRSHNDIGCADLCRDIRHWWQSEDSPGIPAIERIARREGLRNRLFSQANFSRFPPATIAMNGWPLQLWEALLANIDAKALLYGLCHRGTYNVRSFSSMMGETFFSELVLHDKAGKGAVTSKEFGRFIGATVEKVQARLDPARTFAYRTSKSNVYDLVEESETLPDDMKFCPLCNEDNSVLPKNIIPVDHTFDKAERKRLKGRCKPETVSTSRNAVQRGALGVRWERARRNEAKMLPTDRMGLEDA